MDILISNKEKFNLIKENILNDGWSNLHVVSDFDRTLTYGLVDEKKSSSLISLLEKSCQLGVDYTNKAEALFAKYHQIEIDLSIPLEERKKSMVEWWLSVYDLLIQAGLKKSDLEETIDKCDLKLRDGVSDFLSFLYKNNIPLIIFSAAGCGEMIEIFLKKNNCNYPNIYYIINNFNFDEGGKMISVKEPIIHSLNKDEKILNNFPEVFSSVKDRKNILLLGDSISDLDMANGFFSSNLLKIGFLNFNIEENRDVYTRNFDVVIEGDGDFSFLLNIFK